MIKEYFGWKELKLLLLVLFFYISHVTSSHALLAMASEMGSSFAYEIAHIL